MPPDGRQEVGGRIEAMAHGLEECVIQYLNMLSLEDKPRGESNVRKAIAAFPVLKRVLGL